MAFPCEGGMQGISCPVGVDDARIFGHKGQGEEGSDPDPWIISTGVQLALATKKRVGMAAIADKQSLISIAAQPF